MRDVNVVCISGRLVRDPELRATPGGMSVCQLSVASNRSYKQGNEWKEKASFFDVVVWGGAGENAARYLSKGSRVMVSGYLDQQSWEDRKTGAKRSKVQIVADTIVFPPAASQGPSGRSGRQDDDVYPDEPSENESYDFTAEELPF